MSFTLQPLMDIHLNSNFLLDVAGQGSSRSVGIFTLVAFFILIIACVNFMNLSTALAGRRAKEVGLRKTVGALRVQLIIQFLAESMLLAAISLVIGTLIAAAVGLISGCYPAFFLSSFRPAGVLKGMQVFGGRKAHFRNGLVIFQFSISVILIVSTVVVDNQLNFIRNRDMGFDKENLLYLKMPQMGDLQQNYAALKATLHENAGMADYTLIEHLPTDLATGTTDVTWDGKDPGREIIFPHIGVDGSFIRTFGMHLLAGRTFDDNNQVDRSNYILNETAVKAMGMTVSSAIGKTIAVNGNRGEVIGVVKDFNFKPVQQRIGPLILRYTKRGGFVVVRTSPANMEGNIAKLKSVFQDVYSGYPFSYGFVDQDLSRLYVTEQRMGKLFNVFSVVSVIISCFGLFGLATFAAERRRKEIGVRRVLGASAPGIVALLTADFVKLVAAGLLVASPLAWWAMSRWLDNYVYRIRLSWWIFVLSGAVAILVAILTVSYQSIRAAFANPVDSLRRE